MKIEVIIKNGDVIFSRPSETLEEERDRLTKRISQIDKELEKRYPDYLLENYWISSRPSLGRKYYLFQSDIDKFKQFLIFKGIKGPVVASSAGAFLIIIDEKYNHVVVDSRSYRPGLYYYKAIEHDSDERIYNYYKHRFK